MRRLVQIMYGGHIVDAVIMSTDANGFHQCMFVCHHQSGSTSLWLDYGARWGVRAGEIFKGDDAAIERAAYWIKEQNIQVAAG